MPKLKLSLSCSDQDRARYLMDGSVEVEGIEVQMVVLPSSERHDRMTRHLEFDACEYSLATYLPAKERGLPVTAIPVFPHRQFRHESIFVREEAQLRSPQELAGRPIGIPHYTNTASIWARGILNQDYGLDLNSCTWVTERADEVPGWQDPPGVRVDFRPGGQTLVPLFEKGELDVLIYPALPRPVAQGRPGFGRLFPDYRAVEKAYYQRTRIFPIMHTVVIKDEILAQHPWVALNLTRAWGEAKEKIHAYLPRQSSSLLWYADYWQEQQSFFNDPWIYGIEPNRHVIEQLIDFELKQGIIGERPVVEDLFHASTRDWRERNAEEERPG